MIKEYLSRDLDLNKLYNTYLISVDNPDSAMNEVLEFISSSFYQHQNTITHPDFMLVQKMEGNVKNISVEQIRGLQNFLNKTSPSKTAKYSSRPTFLCGKLLLKDL